MLHNLLNGKPWFAAKSFGYGAGLPIAWQGWLLLTAHCALLIGAAIVTQGRLDGKDWLVMIVVGVVPLPIYAARTEGGWRWRWGNDD
ncbi:hypothetical protein [Sphingomonas sp. SUN039]|uniref:hypothetical protein n=1 Tax=Sphingomonas sp. SUN039 TaxID=2937787 RepID=UPI0021641117|nr:hypothetical protein [Sphingomonas sp. SUN039]UVO55551.1 hypothetical protein M0209_16025 [Sphingomonas sp. SUN039]